MASAVTTSQDQHSAPFGQTAGPCAMTIFGAGRYVDRVKRDAGNWKFASKIVVLDSRQIDTLLAIPI